MSGFLLLLMLILSILPVQTAFGAGATVKATLPEFPVKLNGQVMEQETSKYPFLFYKDITYLPLTWDNLQALGLQSEWNAESGLQIWTNGNNVYDSIRDTPPEQNLTNKRNSREYRVSVAEGPITLRGTEIDNGVELYPFLKFRDVTYLPLTWRFIHDILQLDIRWSEGEGLHVIGGQGALGPIMGEDDQAIYFFLRLSDYKLKYLLRMDKETYNLEYVRYEDGEALRSSLESIQHPMGGKPSDVKRKDRDLYYGDLKLYTLTDQDVWEAAEYGGPVHTYTEFPAGEGSVVLTVNLRINLPVLGPNYGTTYNFLIRDGKVVQLKDFHQRLNRVIPNPDGTVWIASSRLPMRGSWIGGSARLALLDREGKVHLVNDLLDEADVMVLGLTNPGLSNPAAEDGSLYVVLPGNKRADFAEKDERGLYVLNTKLETEWLSDFVDGEYYLDKNRRIYIQKRNNTLEDVAAGRLLTWFDYELAHLKKLERY
jgi:hypothetical protein